MATKSPLFVFLFLVFVLCLVSNVESRGRGKVAKILGEDEGNAKANVTVGRKGGRSKTFEIF